MTDPLHYFWRRFLWPFQMWVRANYNARKAHANYERLLAKHRSIKLKIVKVCFLVNESSKWKMDSVFRLLADDPRYCPVVLLTCADIDWQLDREEKKAKLEANKSFFDRRGIECELAYDCKTDEVIPLNKFHPDIAMSRAS